MRTSLIPSSRTPFDRLTSILVRVLSLIGIVGLLVVVLHSLPGEKGKAASVSAAPNGTAIEPARTASAAPAQATPPRVVSTTPTAAPMTSPPAAPVRAVPPPQPTPAALPPSPVPPAASPAAPAPAAVAAPLPKAAPPAPPVSAAQPAATPPIPVAQPAPTATPPVPAVQPAPTATRTASIETKPEPAPSAAGRLVDLNTASVDELNKLNGAGMIGRSVVKGRPYASPEDLLAKRILNRSTYDRIKDQVTVR